MINNKISVLIPTRGRTDHLLSCVESIMGSVMDINNIEILLKMDDNDLKTIDRVKELLKEYLEKNVVKLIVSPQKTGYAEMHNFYYELFLHSEGEWIMIFNDDARIENKGDFDLLVKPFENKIKIFNHQINGACYDTWFFPIIHRKIIETLGRFSIDTPYIDGWFNVIGKSLNIIEFLPIRIKHLTTEIQDETRTVKEGINHSIKNNFDWSYHISNPTGYIYQDIIKLKRELNI